MPSDPWHWWDQFRSNINTEKRVNVVLVLGQYLLSIKTQKPNIINNHLLEIDFTKKIELFEFFR